MPFDSSFGILFLKNAYNIIQNREEASHIVGEKMNFNVKKFLIIFMIIWLVALLLFIFLFQRTAEDAEPNSANQTMSQVNNPSPERVETGDFGNNVDIGKIIGTWVSNRNPKTLLVLTDEMTYQDDIWLGSGSFKINGPYILLSGDKAYGNKEKVLKYEEKDGESTLFFTIDKYSTTFKPATEADVLEVEAFLKSEEGSNELPHCDGLFEEAYKILSAQPWSSNTESAVFQDTKLTITEQEGGTTEFRYELDGEVTGAEGDPYVYTIPVKIIDVAGTVVATDPMKLYTGADGYFVSFSINGTAYEFSFNPDIDATEQSIETTQTTEAETQKVSEESSEKTNTSPQTGDASNTDTEGSN